VVKFTSSNTIGDSSITDNGTTIALGSGASVDVSNGDIATGGGNISTVGGEIATGGGDINMSGGGDINGNGSNNINSFNIINANVKNFDIEHPSKKEPWRLRYSVLEGPEIGAFVRGEIEGSMVIELPEYWVDLISEKTLSVNLTPIGTPSIYYVEKIENNKIYIGTNSESVHFYYTVFAERKDVDKLIVEYLKKD
jgi:hypothetical protein